MAKFESHNGFWGDTKMAPNISVAQLSPTNDTDFPKWWHDNKIERGKAWLFYPADDELELEGNCFVEAPQITICLVSHELRTVRFNRCDTDIM